MRIRWVDYLRNCIYTIFLYIYIQNAVYILPFLKMFKRIRCFAVYLIHWCAYHLITISHLYGLIANLNVFFLSIVVTIIVLYELSFAHYISWIKQQQLINTYDLPCCTIMHLYKFIILSQNLITFSIYFIGCGCCLIFLWLFSFKWFCVKTMPRYIIQCKLHLTLYLLTYITL